MHAPPARPVNEATFSALGNGVTLMHARFGDHAFERHSHDCFAVGITTHGVQRFRCRGKRYDSRVGDLVLFNPDEDHDGSPGTADGFRYTIWYVPDEVVAGCLAAEGGPAASRYFAAPHVTDRRMADAFASLSAGLGAAPMESLRVESTMRAVLAALLARHGERPGAVAPPHVTSRASLERVRDYMRTYYQHDITVADLAGVAGMSRAHLTRAFGAAYRSPPHVYLNAIRVARAKTLIRQGMPLAAVALECGFADQSHLTRRFRGSVGITPADWRAVGGA